MGLRASHTHLHIYHAVENVGGINKEGVMRNPPLDAKAFITMLVLHFIQYICVYV